jgi:predicted amidohydrolase YtcJ
MNRCLLAPSQWTAHLQEAGLMLLDYGDWIMMKMNARIAVLTLLMVFGSGCESTTTPTSEKAPPTSSSDVPQSLPRDFAVPDSFPEIHEYLAGAKVISHDDMASLDEESWYAEQTVVGGEGFILSVSGEEKPYLGNRHGFVDGEAALMRIRFNAGAQFEANMELGEWDTQSFKRWGLYKMDYFEGNVWRGKRPLESQELFSGPLAPLPDRWYYVLFIVGKDRGNQYIWEADSPSNTAQYTYLFESDWMSLTWNFVMQVFEGESEIGEFTVLVSESGERPASSTAAPTATLATTEDSVGPLQAADIIFHNGRVVTMSTDRPLAQAIAVSGESIVAVGDEEQVLAFAGERTRIIDLEGRTLMPGFVDPHTHIFDSGAPLMGMSLVETQQSAIENGVTSIGGFMNEDEFRTVQGMNANGSLRLRINIYLVATGACGESYGTWYKQFAPTRRFGEMIRINGIKMFADGGTCGYPAVGRETHPGAGQGDLWFTNQQMNDMVMEANKAGYQVTIHALGDRAIRQAQDAIIYADGGPDNPLRNRIEHNYYLSDDLIPRYQEYGILPVIFGQFSTCSVVSGLDRTDYWKTTIARWRELLDANPNLPIAAKSDTPYMGQENPLISLYSLTTMREVAEDGSICMPPGWLAERAIAIGKALPMVTIHAAYVLFREEELGSLEAGKLADLIILSGNPLETAPEDLIDLEVWMTMIGGNTEYCATGHQGMCP